jgi:hypothetical protein
VLASWVSKEMSQGSKGGQLCLRTLTPVLVEGVGLVVGRPATVDF